MGNVELTAGHSITRLSLPIEVYNALIRADKSKIEDLTNLCLCELLDIPCMGWEATMKVVDALVANKFSLNRQCVRLRTGE